MPANLHPLNPASSILFCFLFLPSSWSQCLHLPQSTPYTPLFFSLSNFEVWFWYYFLFLTTPNVEDYITGHHFKLCRLLCSLNIVPWQTESDVGQRSFLLRSWLLLWSKPWRDWIQRGLKKAIFSWEHLLPTSENRKYALEFLIYTGWKCMCSRWWVLDKCFWSVANAW